MEWLIRFALLFQVGVMLCIMLSALLQRWIGLDWIGLDWIGLDWIGLDWIGSDWIGLDDKRLLPLRQPSDCPAAACPRRSKPETIDVLMRGVFVVCRLHPDRLLRAMPPNIPRDDGPGP